MQIMKIRLEDGTWQGIPTLRGQDGDDGSNLLYTIGFLPSTGSATITKSDIDIPDGHNLTVKDIVFNLSGIFTQVDAIDGDNVTVNFLFQVTAGAPVRGTDYWTTEDQQQIVQEVLNQLPSAEGVGY